MDSVKTNIKKETKNKIVVDYEGKLTAKERILKKLQASNTWIMVGVSILKFILMLGVSFVIIYPFVARIAGSFMTKEDVIDSTISLIPKHFTLNIYKAIFVENHYLEAITRTTFLSLACALIQTFIACVIGYGLAKFRFKGNKLVMGLVVFTMVIPHSTLSMSMLKHFESFDLFASEVLGNKGIIQLITGNPIGGLNLTNTFSPFIILSIFGLAFKNGLYIYLMRQFFKGVPDELEESAYVDGSGVFRTFIQIIIPLAVPMMITIFLFAFSWQWTDEFYTNMFFPIKQGVNAKYMMPDVYKVPRSLVLEMANFSGAKLYSNVVQNTGGMMIIAPLIILYLFCQKYLVQGIERSGLVG